MYIETSWGKRLSWLFGSYGSALTVHKYVGIFMIDENRVHEDLAELANGLTREHLQETAYVFYHIVVLFRCVVI